MPRETMQPIMHATAQVTQAILVVPPGWGPQRRTRLRHAAHRAGLTDIEMVDAAAALAHHHTQPSTPGHQHLVLVCRLVGTEADSTILRPDNAGFDGPRQEAFVSSQILHIARFAVTETADPELDPIAAARVVSYGLAGLPPQVERW